MAVLQEKTTAKVKNGVAYFEYNSFTLSNVDKVKTVDFSKYAYASSLNFSRNDNDLNITYSGKTVTIKDYFNEKGAVISTVKTIRAYDGSQKNKYKDYNLVSSGLLNAISSGVEDFAIKKGVITGTAFADTISAVDFKTPTGKNKDTGVTINTGAGNDDVTGTSWKDTFNITGSGTKTINIKATDGEDTIKGINTNGASLVLNLSNTVLDSATTAANNTKYERVGNDLKITASETVPSKITDLSNYVWYTRWNSTKESYDYNIIASDDPSYNYYYYGTNSFSSNPLYSYQDGDETKITQSRDITTPLADAYLLIGYNAYDGNHFPEGNIYKLFTTEEAANTFKSSYYTEDADQEYGGHDTCEITKLSDLTTNDQGKKILYSYKKRSYATYHEAQVYSKTAPTENEPIKYSDMYLHKDGTSYIQYYQRSIDTYSLKTEDQKVDGDIKISELGGSIYYNQDNKFFTESPYYFYYTEIPKDSFDTTYYLSPELFFVSDYKEIDVEKVYYKYNEQDYRYTESKAPDEIAGNCTIVDTQAPEYTKIDTIYSYVKNGSMAYSFDPQTANYVEGVAEPDSSTTIIKDYFKSPTAPDVEIGLKDVKLIDALNKTNLVNIDRQYELNKDGSVKVDKDNNPVIQTGKQTINGTFLNNVITGGQGNDTINLAGGNDIVNAGKGNDTINIKNDGFKIITINNDDGNDTITGTNTYGARTYLNFTDIDVDSVYDAQNNLEYIRNKNNLEIKRTYTVGEEEKTSTTTIKDYFKSSTSIPDVYFGDGSNANVSLYSVLSGFDAGVKGTPLNDIITGTKRADKITTGTGKDIITGGQGNDKITIDGRGSKYIVMNTGDGVDTVDTKVDDYIYLQFKGADITNETTAKNNLTYEKSGKNDIKITSTVESSAIIAPKGYISNTGIDTDKMSYYFTSASMSYITKVTKDTGLYSYEMEGETRYTTEKNETVKLNTAKLVQSRNRYTEYVDSVGLLTTSADYSAYPEDYTVTDLSNEAITTLYAYKNRAYSGDYEYVYSTNQVNAIKYSDLYLKPTDSGSSYYKFVTESEKTDDCLAVKDQSALYLNYFGGEISLEKMYDGQEVISSDEYDSIFYVDKNHTYVVDIDNNSTTPIYKTYDIANSYYLKRPNNMYGYDSLGMAVASALTKNNYTKIDLIYKTTGDDGKVVLSFDEPENFKEDITSTSVIVKDYLTKGQSVLITNSDNTNSARWVSNMLSDIGLNIGDASSKKAQTLTGSNLNDNIYGGLGKDKITTGTSNSYGRGDIITPGKGNDTITIDGNGYKTVNIANGDGNDTIIFTDNNKNTVYDYTGKTLYLNYDNDAGITYDMNGKDLVINRKYDVNGKEVSATTTLKGYFNAESKEDLSYNIYVNNTKFRPLDYFDNSIIDKSSGKKAQKINGNIFDNTIIGGSGNDTINGCGGSDTLDGGNGSDTYIVNYKSGSKHNLSDKIVISDTGEGANDVDTLKLDVIKSDMALLFNVNKISDKSAYTDNDIIVGSGDSAIHYSYDKQLMVFADIEQLDEGVRNNSGKFTSAYGIIADGIEKITNSDNKTITLDNIKQIAQDVAGWLSTTSYDSSAAVLDSSTSKDILTMFAKYNPNNAMLKEYINAG